MIADHGPYGEHGPHVLFRLEDAGTMLWRCSMSSVPMVDTLVGQIEDGETDVTTWYKVESVRHEFYRPEGGYFDGGGNPVPFEASAEYYGVCVYVSEVP